ncbi:hypothetical protein FQZ97_898940 [compost metagenome]
MADVAQADAGPDHHDAFPHGLIGHLRQPACLHRAGGFASDHVHAAVVAEPAVGCDDGDVDVEDVALLECLLVRNSMADHVVDGGAQVTGVGRVTAGLVADGGRDRALLLHELGRKAVDLEGGHARLDQRREVVQHFGGQAASHPHAFDARFVFVGDAHGRRLSHRAMRRRVSAAMTGRATRVKSALRPPPGSTHLRLPTCPCTCALLMAAMPSATSKSSNSCPDWQPSPTRSPASRPASCIWPPSTASPTRPWWHAWANC